MISIRNNINNFIVASNNCYIDSVLMALFYFKTSTEHLLLSDVDSCNAIHLQEYIKVNFVDKVRNGISVLDANLIKQLSIDNGWEDNPDVSKYYAFLLKLFDGNAIEIQRRTITELDPKPSDIGEIQKIPFIPLIIKPGISYNIKSMLHDWFYEDYLKTTINGQETSVLNTYNMVNTPPFFGISIDRTEIDESINIQKKIAPQDNYKGIWIFHSAICYKKAHYYSLLFNPKNETYHIFDNSVVPCVREINMSDDEITDKIKRECVFILYRYKI